jgi:hypothetical protein
MKFRFLTTCSKSFFRVCGCSFSGAARRQFCFVHLDRCRSAHFWWVALNVFFHKLEKIFFCEVVKFQGENSEGLDIANFTRSFFSKKSILFFSPLERSKSGAIFLKCAVRMSERLVLLSQRAFL